MLKKALAAGLAVSPAFPSCDVASRAVNVFRGGRWPGHQPGRIYLGVSRPEVDLVAATRDLGDVGAHRSFFGWYDLDLEVATIGADRQANRLSWVSFKPPAAGPGSWLQVASGELDEDLRTRAEAYAELDGPLIVTFSHEPVGDASGAPQDFAAAFTHVHDVMHDATGLSTVAFVPVMNDWVFNPRNPAGRPLDYLTPPVLDRSDFVGVDLYQNASGEGFAERLPRVADVLDQAGRGGLMLGIGETGCSDQLPSGPSGAQWWEASWAWAVANTDQLGVVCYFDSTRNSKSGTYWPLDESRTKEKAFIDSVTGGATCLLPEQT